jgi:hypothetical protein
VGTITPAELLQLWIQEQLTPEMAIGHLIQNLAQHQTALDAYGRSLTTLRADLERLRLHAGVNPAGKGTQKPPKKS